MRFRKTYFAADYQREVVDEGKCNIHDPTRFVPLFYSRSVPSRGVRSALFSHVNERPLEVLSIAEKWAGTFFDSETGVIAIMEQVALDPQETISIAAENGTRHPEKDGRLVVMSTDFVVLRRIAGALSLKAYSVKREALVTRADIDKYENIESVYWDRRGVSCTLLLDTKLPQPALSNLLVLHPAEEELQLPCDPKTVGYVDAWLTPHIEAQSLPLAHLCRECDRSLGLQHGDSLGVANHLAAIRRWPVDINRPIAGHLPLPLIAHFSSH